MKKLFFLFFFLQIGVFAFSQSANKSNGNQNNSQSGGGSAPSVAKMNDNTGGGGSNGYSLDDYTKCVQMCQSTFDGNTDQIKECIKGCSGLDNNAVLKPNKDKVIYKNDKAMPVKKN